MWGSRTLYDTLQVPELFRPFVSDYRINVFEIAHLPEEAIGYFSSDFKIVADYFVHRKLDPDYRPKDPEMFQHVDELLKLMSVLTQDVRFAETLQGEGGKPKDMCELLDRVEARGIKKGIEQGIVQGIEQGIDETRLVSIKNIMRNLNLTAMQAMDALGIPSSERTRYTSRLPERGCQ